MEPMEPMGPMVDPGPMPSNASSNRGILYLTGDINTNTIAPIIDTILHANLAIKGDIEYITLLINSEGGDLKDALALIDVIQGSSIPIRTVGLGLVASAALMVFLAGVKGHRIVTPNTMLLSHQYAWGAGGKEHELLGRVKAYKHLGKIVRRHYKKTTGLSRKNIDKYLLPATDMWLTAKDAVRLGIADKVKKMY